MQYKEPENNWNQPEECVPRYDSDGDALNCRIKGMIQTNENNTG